MNKLNNYYINMRVREFLTPFIALVQLKNLNINKTHSLAAGSTRAGSNGAGYPPSSHFFGGGSPTRNLFFSAHLSTILVRLVEAVLCVLRKTMGRFVHVDGGGVGIVFRVTFVVVVVVCLPGVIIN